MAILLIFWVCASTAFCLALLRVAARQAPRRDEQMAAGHERAVRQKAAIVLEKAKTASPASWTPLLPPHAKQDTRTMALVEAATGCRLAQSRFTDSGLLRRAEATVLNGWSQLTVDQPRNVDRRVKDFTALSVVDADSPTKGWEMNPASGQEDGRFGR